MKLGSMQRTVLTAVLEHGDPRHGVVNDYGTWTRRKTVAFKLLARGWLELLPHNHPGVVNGWAKQWRITPAGKEALSK